MDLDLCLDLDNTLICCLMAEMDNENDLLKEISSDIGDINNQRERLRLIKLHKDHLIDSDNENDYYNDIIVIFRPYLREFLRWATTFFRNIYVWSAGVDRYVKMLESLIFTDFCNVKESFKIMSRNTCIIRSDGHTIKDMAGKHFDLTKTLFIDDTQSTFELNPLNAIHIPAYKPYYRNNNDRIVTLESLYKNDNCLELIMRWAIKNECLLRNNDIRKIDKKLIFN